MNHIEDTNFRRVQKRTAKRLFNNGFTLIVVACKVSPNNENFAFELSKNDYNTNFETSINNFTYYNCSYETGYYPAFYLKETKLPLQ